MSELGYILRLYRTKNHITQEKMAEHMGVSINTVHLWETKMCMPSMASLMALSDLLEEPLGTVMKKACNSYT